MRSSLPFIVVLLLAVVSACSSPPQHDADQSTRPQQSVRVRATGVGSSLSETQKIANRNAIQEVFGALTVSERRVTNDQLLEDDVSYSRGIIEKSRLLRYYQDPKSGLFHADYDITVSASTLEKRLMYAGDAKSVDGRTLGERMAQGRQQADYEVDRHLRAQALLAHLLKGLPDSLYFVRNGQVKTTRTGYDFQTTLEVFASVDERTLESLIYALSQYRDTRLPSASAHYLQMGGLFEINQSSFLLEESHFVRLDQSLQQLLDAAFGQMGICLAFLDANKMLIRQHFAHIPVPLGLDEQPSTRAGVSRYFMNFIRNGDMDYRNRAGMNNKLGGQFVGEVGYGITSAKEIAYVVQFPVMSTQDINRIQEITSKVTVQKQCD